jgi:hypothetical protein
VIAIATFGAMGAFLGRSYRVPALAALIALLMAVFAVRSVILLRFGLHDALLLTADLAAMQVGYVLGALSGILWGEDGTNA